MRILALDIGAGTEDVLLYDDEKKSVENCVKMVLPAPSKIYADKIRGATLLRQDLFLKGDVIGGGAFASALMNHIKEGLRVFMTQNSAYTVRNDLDQVRELGIRVVEADLPENNNIKTLILEEVSLDRMKVFLAAFGEDISDVNIVAVAVQDHGVFPKGMSNRMFRIRKMRELLKKDQRVESLAFWGDEIPTYFLRMKSAEQACRRQLPETQVLVMDTAPAAILGCLCDTSASLSEYSLAVNVGNGHTMAALTLKGRIVGLMEHHTQLLNPEKIERILIDFADGKLTDEEVFKDGGHGLFLLEESLGFSRIKKIVATGPNRKILKGTNLNVHYAGPAGDVMMTGPIGLVEAAKRKTVEGSK